MALFLLQGGAGQCQKRRMLIVPFARIRPKQSPVKKEKRV
jgi:hypothetical protein